MKRSFVCVLILLFVFSAQATVQPISINEGMWNVLTRIGVSTDVVESKVCVIEDAVGCIVITQADMPFATTGSGTYCLAENVSVAAGTAITIDHDDVIIDLHGFVIDGQESAATGIASTGQSNITIQNGAIRNFMFQSVEMTNTSTVHIQNIDCERGIRSISSYYNVVKNCSINARGRFFAYQLSNCRDCVIDSSFFANAGTFGIGFDGIVSNGNHRVSNCQIRDCGVGLSVSNNSEIVIENCMLSYNSSVGIQFISDSAHCVVKECFIGECGTGVLIDDGYRNIIMDCQIMQSTVFGISIEPFSTDNKVINTSIVGTIGTGIRDTSGGNFFFGNIVLESTVADYSGVSQPILSSTFPGGLIGAGRWVNASS